MPGARTRSGNSATRTGTGRRRRCSRRRTLPGRASCSRSSSVRGPGKPDPAAPLLVGGDDDAVAGGLSPADPSAGLDTGSQNVLGSYPILRLVHCPEPAGEVCSLKHILCRAEQEILVSNLMSRPGMTGVLRDARHKLCSVPCRVRLGSTVSRVSFANCDVASRAMMRSAAR